eukprot:613951-Prorocentrum_minimum.AAC.2
MYILIRFLTRACEKCSTRFLTRARSARSVSRLAREVFIIDPHWHACAASARPSASSASAHRSAAVASSLGQSCATVVARAAAMAASRSSPSASSTNAWPARGPTSAGWLGPSLSSTPSAACGPVTE